MGRARRRRRCLVVVVVAAVAVAVAVAVRWCAIRGAWACCTAMVAEKERWERTGADESSPNGASAAV